MNMSMMIILGAIVLIFLSYNDYRENVVKPESDTIYYLAFLLFTILNVTVYLTLCTLFLDINMNNIEITLFENNFKQIMYLFPLAIAFTYFGIGAGSIKIGSFELKLYSKILELFKHMFPDNRDFGKILDTSPILPINGRDYYDHLTKEINMLQATAEQGKGWNGMENIWKEVNEDSTHFIGQIEELSSIHNELNVWPMQRENLDKISHRIEAKVESLWSRVNLMLTRFTIQFILANFKDIKRQEEAFISLGILKEKVTARGEINPLIRIIGVSIFSGLLVGLVTGVGNKTKDPFVNMWCGALAFTGFALFFSSFYKIKNVGLALLSGITGGALGHFLWVWFAETQKQYIMTKSITIALQNANVDFRKLIIGGLYGGMIALILFSFKRCQIDNNKRYCMVTLSGSVSFMALLFLFSSIFEKTLEISSIFGSALMGAVVLLGIAYAGDIFRIQEESSDPTSPPL